MNETSTAQLACPHCLALNRVPEQRLADHPACGRCHQPLFTATALTLDDTGFQAHAMRSTVPLLVDFWAPWCGPCMTMAPAFAEAAIALEPQVRLAKVDTEAQPALAARFNIRSIPTLVLLQQGRELARQSGAMNTSAIVRWVRSQLG